MNIKSRLTIQFGTISSAILALILLSIYLLSENYRKEEYYERLVSRSVNLAKLLIEVDEIDESLLYRIEEDNPVRLPEEALRIYNYRDDVIFDLDEENVLPTDRSLINRIRLDSMITFQEGEREFLGLLFTSRYDRFVIMASAIDIFGNRKIKNLRNILIIAFILGGFITILTARFYANQAMRPVKNLILQVEGLTPEDLSIRLKEAEGTDEIAQIAQAFNEMLIRVDDAFRTQKNFIANASHEMRTPLTAISGQLEVLALQDRTTEEYKDTIASVIDDMHRLNRLANRLLLLAQTESEGVKSSFTDCRIDDILWSCIGDVQKMNPLYQVNVEMDEALDDDSLTINGSETLLSTVLFNLAENACKYSDDHKATISLCSVEGELTIAVGDQGIGIPKKDLDSIFAPFFRGSNVAQRPGHGIGLSLVQRIVNLHQGSVNIASEEGVGTTITVRFQHA
ncbi:MAG: HAMP domain-containing sensor histidine kinase [Flavobacteriales bacterium]